MCGITPYNLGFGTKPCELPFRVTSSISFHQFYSLVESNLAGSVPGLGLFGREDQAPGDSFDFGLERGSGAAGGRELLVVMTEQSGAVL